MESFPVGLDLFAVFICSDIVTVHDDCMLRLLGPKGARGEISFSKGLPSESAKLCGPI